MGAVVVNIRLQSLDAFLRRAHGGLRALTPAEGLVLDRWGAVMVQYIKDRWPVDTGTSRDRWTFEVRGSPGGIGIQIENDMFYADYVHRVGDPSKTPIWQGLVTQAFMLAKDQMLAEARQAVQATEAAARREVSRRAPRTPSQQRATVQSVFLRFFRQAAEGVGFGA